jgi:hypothetical protein
VPSSAARAAVPFVDLAPQHDEVARDLRARIDAVLDAIGHLKGVQKTMSSIVLSVKFER